ncbi:uncharacterized protein LACBIDRAFT_300161 [Laccaria bicolor S238N-H82]|uniref:Predicted protein n=1 Tax=Laccaria bicolor (strain S238N-H82 / ATCC MYA-4686) TaxID=486041 RepID=B0DG62_LACBS|nr:uncharacterized protein LACBIDRAFT_300161 [Laccaria bicolor S238N-H82]EDR06587.1 predicted protein [Laccaria bicolor S238N-H82]|eukprot:XP_001882959.1 predicted protein [Laccaria bicolor S238N-H82]
MADACAGLQSIVRAFVVAGSPVAGSAISASSAFAASAEPGSAVPTLICPFHKSSAFRCGKRRAVPSRTLCPVCGRQT